MRNEQSRWKIGTARRGRREREGGRSSLRMERGSVQTPDRLAASPCNSLEPDEGREGGASGQRCRAGEGQQEGVTQLAGSELQHLQVGTEPAEASPCDSAVAPGAAAATPNINASSIATNLWTKVVIRTRPAGSTCTGRVSGELSPVSNPLSSCFLPRGRATQSRNRTQKSSPQFFRVPQSSMDLP
jgi:hypothetical protein